MQFLIDRRKTAVMMYFGKLNSQFHMHQFEINKIYICCCFNDWESIAKARCKVTSNELKVLVFVLIGLENFGENETFSIFKSL